MHGRTQTDGFDFGIFGVELVGYLPQGLHAQIIHRVGVLLHALRLGVLGVAGKRGLGHQLVLGVEGNCFYVGSANIKANPDFHGRLVFVSRPFTGQKFVSAENIFSAYWSVCHGYGKCDHL